MNLRLALIVMVSGFNVVAQPTEDIISGAASMRPLRGAVTLVPPTAAGMAVAENGTLASMGAAAAGAGAAASAAGGAGGDAADDRISVEIVPGIGVGPIKFGMGREEVRSRLESCGVPMVCEFNKKMISYELIQDNFMGIKVSYLRKASGAVECEFIEVNCGDLKAYFNGKEVSSMSPKQAIACFADHDVCKHPDYGYLLPKLDLVMAYYHEPDDSEDDMEVAIGEDPDTLHSLRIKIGCQIPGTLYAALKNHAFSSTEK